MFIRPSQTKHTHADVNIQLRIMFDSRYNFNWNEYEKYTNAEMESENLFSLINAQDIVRVQLHLTFISGT